MSKPDLDYLKQVWQQEIGSTQWIERKEISAWTALAFYIVGLSLVFKIFFDYKHPIEGYTIWIVIVGLVCLLYIAFSFIQSQYSISYHRRAYQAGVRSTIYKIVMKQSIDLSIEERKSEFKEVLAQCEKARKREQPLKGALYPLQNTVSLFFNIPINWLRCINRNKRPELRRREKEEAAIYASMLLGNAFLMYYLIWKKWPQRWWVCVLVYLGIIVGVICLALYKEKKLDEKEALSSQLF